jgi:hypothetical protein
MRAVILGLFAVSCSMQSNDRVKEIASVELKEASALEKVQGSDLLWAIEDAGNSNTIYGIGTEGKIKAEIIVNSENTDWESLASDSEGNLYIGDFGNNENDRQDLAIYKIDKAGLKAGNAKVSSTVNFYYPEQKEFPPHKTNRIFDCEGFIEYNGNFFLFTKNRSSKSEGSFNIYKVPNKAGKHAAVLIGTLSTCSEKSCQVTGADISDDGKTIALLTADKVYLVTGFTAEDFNNAKVEPLDLGHSSQKEGICFKNNNTLLIVDEKAKAGGGKIYEVKLTD